MNIYYISAFFLYVSIIFVIGLLANYKQNSAADFIMGNRSLNFWLVALAAHASDMSAWLFMGLPMAMFLLGLSQIWIAIGLLLGMFLNWQFIAPRLRSQTEEYNCYTLSSFFEKRFNDPSGVLRVVSAFALLMFMTHYLSAGMIGSGILLETLFGFNYYVGLFVSLCVIVGYIYVGGFVAIAWTDLFQGIFLLFVILIVPWTVFQHVGSISSIESAAHQNNISLNLFPNNDFLGVLTMVLLAMSWGLGYFGMPHVITKFMGIKNVNEINKSKWFGMTWQMFALGGALMVGLLAIPFFNGISVEPQMIFIEMSRKLFHPLTAGFILCAVLGASLSTMGSQILVCASVICEDLYSPFFEETNPQKKLKISRIGVLVISLLGFLLCLNKSTTIMDTVLYSWTGLGSSFGPLVLVSLYSKKVNMYGATAGILGGAIMAMTWPHLNTLLFSYTIPPMIPGFVFGALCIFLVSYLMRNKIPLELQRVKAKL